MSQTESTKKSNKLRNYLLLILGFCVVLILVLVIVRYVISDSDDTLEQEPNRTQISAVDVDYDSLYTQQPEAETEVQDNFDLIDNVSNELAMYAEQELENKLDCDVGAGWTEPTTSTVEFAPGVLKLIQEASLRLCQAAYVEDNFVFSPYATLDYMIFIANASIEDPAAEIGNYLVYGSLNDWNVPYLGDLIAPLDEFRNKIELQHEFRSYKAYYCSRLMLSAAKNRFKLMDIDYNYEPERDELFDISDVNSYFAENENRIQFSQACESDIIFASSGMFEVSWEQDAECYYTNHGFTSLDGSNNGSAYYFQAPEGQYLSSGNAVGISVPFNYGHYDFVAIMPNGDFGEYVSEFSYDEYVSLLNSAEPAEENVYLPKFALEREYNFSDMLKAQGLTKPFEYQNGFSFLSGDPDGFALGEMLHKSYFSLNARGARTWDTVTDVRDADMAEDGLWFDRPFMFLIVDKTTQVPVMMGAVVTI